MQDMKDCIGTPKVERMDTSMMDWSGQQGDCNLVQAEQARRRRRPIGKHWTQCSGPTVVRRDPEYWTSTLHHFGAKDVLPNGDGFNKTVTGLSKWDITSKGRLRNIIRRFTVPSLLTCAPT
jgi:hypothetical protein